MHPFFEVTMDEQKCLHCGSCARTCSTGHLRFKEGRVEIKEHATCIGCGHCVAVCPVQAFALNGKGPLAVPENDLEKRFMLRRSVRHFKEQLPPKEMIEHALNITEYAPSGKNFHATKWIILYGKEQCERIRDIAFTHCRKVGEAPEILKFFEKGLDLLTCGAPVIVIGYSPDNALNPVIDTVIALHMAQMMLEEQGLGCCWGGYMRQITGHSPEMREALGIPEGSAMRGCFMTGYPEQETYCNIPPRPEADVHWIEKP